MSAPRFWSGRLDPRSREAAPLTRLFLSPLSWIYSSVSKLKVDNASPYRSDAKVICVGNLTAGGVGKSPVVAAIVERLKHLTDLKVATLSRGYGGRLKGPLKVDSSLHSSKDVGDEPLVHAMQGSAWIGGDRAEAARLMTQDSVDLIVMDDGHQNPGLAKDISIVVIDLYDPFGNGHVIPKGPLREPVERGLSRANAIIGMGDGDIPKSVKASNLQIFRSRIIPSGPPPEGPLVAFAGIGRPQKFFDTLAEVEADVRDAVPFPDHHEYSPADRAYLEKLATDHGARLITTQKDKARLVGSRLESALVLPIEAQFEDPTALDRLLLSVLNTE